MSQDIIKEVMFLLHFFLMGIIITFLYDGFLILRRLMKHTILLISLEDMIFWIACAISAFYMLYEENNGVLRWFAVAGAALGMLVYKKTISDYWIEGAVRVLSFFLGLIRKLMRILFGPLRFAGEKLGAGGRRLNRVLHHRGSRICKYMKKKLTQGKKVLRIIISKH